MKQNKFVLPSTVLSAVVLWTTGSQAAPFTYNPSDMLLGFRSASSANDLVVNIGPSSFYYGSGPGTFAVGGFSPSQLTSVFGGMNGLSFSAFGDVRTSGSASYPLNTLWVTSPRLDPNVQSDPWNRQSQFSQGNTGAKIDGIATGALNFSSSIPADANNTATAVSLPKNFNGGGVSYSLGIGAAGNFAGAFQGSAENSTAADFSTVGGPVRSDLYELKPGSGAGLYLGYFEFLNNGSMSFTVVPEPSTLGLLAAGIAVLAARRQFRRRS